MPKTKNSAQFADLYKKVNTDLVVETARKAKAEGVKQFLFMSSASVYGLEGAVGHNVMITADTPLLPADNYGISKKNAEEQLLPLEDESFKIVILRPPMIYGKGCRGNYVTLAKLAKKLPVFPYMHNQRSMLYIDNLSEFVRLMIDKEERGTFCPQNNEYVNTSEMVSLIAHASGKNILMIHGFTWAVKMLRPLTGMADKAFGSLCYDYALSRYHKNYCVKNFQESILETEQ
jgi:UDP-glucose 4-epimerase